MIGALIVFSPFLCLLFPFFFLPQYKVITVYVPTWHVKCLCKVAFLLALRMLFDKVLLFWWRKKRLWWGLFSHSLARAMSKGIKRPSGDEKKDRVQTSNHHVQLYLTKTEFLIFPTRPEMQHNFPFHLDSELSWLSF